MLNCFSSFFYCLCLSHFHFTDLVTMASCSSSSSLCQVSPVFRFYSQNRSSSNLGLFVLGLCITPFGFTGAEFSSIPGINYGQEGNNLLLPLKSMELIKSLKAKRVKIYDANPEILKALSNTNHEVSIMVPNQLIVNVSFNQTLADKWVKTNVLLFYPQTLIRYLLVGNEVITSSPLEVWAIRRIKHSLKHFRIHKVKVRTLLAMDVLESSFIEALYNENQKPGMGTEQQPTSSEREQVVKGIHS